MKNLYGYKLVRAAKQSELKNATSSAEEITRSSVNVLCRKKSEHLQDVICIE